MTTQSSTDFHYYNALKDIFKAKYDWEHLLITAGCSRDELVFSKPFALMTATELKAIQRFIHEYIHYLQNFSTTWGAGIFSDFILSYFKIGASIANGQEKFTIPLNNAVIGNNLFDDGINQRVKVLERLNKTDKCDCDLKRNITELRFYYDGQKTVLDNGVVKYTVGVKAIKEHMANLGTFIMLGYDDKRIHKENISCIDFLDEEGRLVSKPWYWIVFEYFHENYPALKNIGKGLFFLMNECLTRLNPDEAFNRFFQFFILHPDKLILGKDFFDILNEWIGLPAEVISYTTSYDKTLENVMKRKKTTDTNTENDLLKACPKILQMLLDNMGRTGGGRGLFPNTFNFTEPPTWLKHIERYGTGMISFNQNVVLMGTPEYCATFHDPFLVLNSVSLALNEVNEGNTAKIHCPFLVDIPICNSHYKDRDPAICEHDALKMLTIQTGDSFCNFVRGIKLLALDKRLQ